MFFVTGWKINEILELTLDQFMFIGEANFSFLSSILGEPKEKKGKGKKGKGIVAKFKEGRTRDFDIDQARLVLPIHEE